MFDQIIRRCNNVKKLNSDKILEKVFNTPSAQLKVELLNIGQLQDRHVTADGKQITRYYSAGSQKYFGKPNSPIILKDSGAFYNSIRVKSESDSIIVSGDNIKATENGDVNLDGYIGGKSIGLDEKSLSEVREFVRPMVIEAVREDIFT